MTEAAQRDEVLASLRALASSTRTASDGQLLEDGDFWEAVGRLDDHRRAAVAAEVAWRSRPHSPKRASRSGTATATPSTS